MYGNLVDQIRERLPVLHRYFRLRARALGVPHLTYHDLHCPIAEGPRASYTVEQAAELVRESMAPLGARYAEPLRRAFESRWIDWHPVPGKRSGAYSHRRLRRAPLSAPQLQRRLREPLDPGPRVGALHAHVPLRPQRSPTPRHDYAIFVAEVASTFNENLLFHHMLEPRERRRRRACSCSAATSTACAHTLFRQTLFAEFELAIHEKAERGESR